jgi:DNA-binding IclR family transcriptional regulator
VIPGVSSVGVPIRVAGQLPAAIAVVYIHTGLDNEEIGRTLQRAAAAIEAELR